MICLSNDMLQADVFQVHRGECITALEDIFICLDNRYNTALKKNIIVLFSGLEIYMHFLTCISNMFLLTHFQYY